MNKVYDTPQRTISRFLALKTKLQLIKELRRNTTHAKTLNVIEVENLLAKELNTITSTLKCFQLIAFDSIDMNQMFRYKNG